MTEIRNQWVLNLEQEGLRPFFFSDFKQIRARVGPCDVDQIYHWWTRERWNGRGLDTESTERRALTAQINEKRTLDVTEASNEALLITGTYLE